MGSASHLRTLTGKLSAYCTFVYFPILCLFGALNFSFHDRVAAKSVRSIKSSLTAGTCIIYPVSLGPGASSLLSDVSWIHLGGVFIVLVLGGVY